MFFINQEHNSKKRYENLLRIVTSLTKLYSENSLVPFLHYRSIENIFCKAFRAKNLALSDISIDAQKHDKGIGLKTFLHKNGSCLEKIAEFNKVRSLYKDMEKSPHDLIQKIAHFRNERLLATCNICGISVNNLLYHCITREKEKLNIHEEPMSLIKTECISNILAKDNVIHFSDGINEYCFNKSKSTLLKRFNITSIYEIQIQIIDDPFTLLEQLTISSQPNNELFVVDRICLPLYSYDKATKMPIVPERSGLNQWNAKGRERNPNEVYIPIPIEVRRNFPDFFPSRDKSFLLKLPSGFSMKAKICQDGGNALMSDPNSSLGKWILRDVLVLKEGELLTYEKLEEIGIDAVQILKYNDNTFEINFKKLGSYEQFMHG